MVVLTTTCFASQSCVISQNEKQFSLTGVSLKKEIPISSGFLKETIQPARGWDMKRKTDTCDQVPCRCIPRRPAYHFALVVLLAPLLWAGAEHGSGVAVEGEEYVAIERLSERVVLAYWLGTGRCNLTAIQSQKGLVIIDTERSPRIMAPIKKKIEQVFGRNDWAYVINTHAHDNHAGGNCLFKEAVVIGHDNLDADMQWLRRTQSDADWKRRDLEHADQTLRNLQACLPQVAGNRANTRRIQGEIKFWQLYKRDMEEGYAIVKPSLTFADTHTLDLGDLRLELVFFGKGHSLSDILIYAPQERLLVTGAIVYQRAHLPEISEQSQLDDVHRFLSVLDRFLAKEVKIDRVISSHSQPLLRSDLVPIRDYYQRMLAGVRAAWKAGLTVDQATERLAVRTCFPAFDLRILGQWARGMHERNVNNLWHIVSEEQQTPQIRHGTH
jgi:glyoxylase-like metal-dependent hydrolase (beta-lactamase superfamily II)